MKVLVVCFTLLFVATLRADYDAALDAYQSGDYDQAYVEWLKVASSPPESVPPEIMAESCYALGMLFWVGQGVVQDTAASAHWLLRAAELGHPGAQTKLGFLYGAGQGVQQSDFEALKWTHMAANQGDVDAQYNLAVMYRDGQGVVADPELALKWFREAANNGDQVSADVVANYEKYGWPIAANDETLPIESTEQSVSDGSAESTPLEEPVDVVLEKPEVPVDEAVASNYPPESEPTEVTDEAPAKIEVQNDEEWIRQRDPQHFTIQVIALLSQEKLHSFIASNEDWEPFAIYQQVWKNQPLFVLLQGDYDDVEQARAAAARFPSGLQKRTELWIRKFGMVQSLLKDE